MLRHLLLSCLPAGTSVRLLALGLLLAAPAATAAPEPAAGAGPDAFGLNLLLRVAARHPGNICLSPWGAGSALSAFQSGAAGPLRLDVDAVLGDPGRWNLAAQRSGIEQAHATQVYVDQGATQAVATAHPAAIALDLRGQPAQSRSIINARVCRETQGRIPQLLPEGCIDHKTLLVVASAQHFQGEWAMPFARAKTRARAFHTEDGKHVQVPMMRARLTCPQTIMDRCAAIALPYLEPGTTRSGQVYFIALLPPEGESLRSRLARLTPQKLAELRHRLADRNAAGEARVALPRCTIQGESIDLTGPLQELGLQMAPSPGSAPGAQNAYRFYQQCTVEIDERGTRAVNAQAVVESFGGLTFVADRPFLWMIATLTPEDPPFFMGLFEHP